MFRLLRMALPAQGLQDAGFRSLHRAGVNVEGRPEENAAVSFGGESQDFHFGVALQEHVTNRRPFVRVIERNDQEIRVRSVYHLHDFRFVLNFCHDFDIRLLSDGLHHKLAHQAGLVRHNNSNGCRHRLDSNRTIAQGAENEKVQWRANWKDSEKMDAVPIQCPTATCSSTYFVLFSVMWELFHP